MSSRASKPGKALHALKEWTLEQFSENPVFIGGLSIAPVVVGATTAANGLILGLAAAFLMLFLSGMCAMGGMLFRVPVQKGLAAFVSAAAFIPVGYVVDTFLPLQSVSLGIYLPLLCVSSIVVMKVPHALAERGSRKDDSLDMEQPDAAEETSVAPEGAVEEQTDTAPLQAEPSAGQERPVNNQ